MSVKPTSSSAITEKPYDVLCLSWASVVQFVDHNLLSLVIFASDLSLHINKFCCVLFSSSWLCVQLAVINKDSLIVVVVCAAGCDKQRFTHRRGRACSRLR